MKSHTRPSLIIAAVLCFLLLTIWGNLTASTAIKYVASGCAIAILAAFIAVVYRNATRETPTSEEPQPIITDRLPVVPPPRPTHPPSTEPILYDYQPRPIPAIGYTAVTVVLVTGLLSATIYTYSHTHSAAVWYIFTIFALTCIAFCYWQWIVWRGRRLIITKSTKQLQRVRPAPFSSSTPTMPNRSGAAQDVTQTMIDRLLGTCRLFSNVRASGDEMFHNLKWLPHPEELRHALGTPALRKNSWWLFSKKNS